MHTVAAPTAAITIALRRLHIWIPRALRAVAWLLLAAAVACGCTDPSTVLWLHTLVLPKDDVAATRATAALLLAITLHAAAARSCETPRLPTLPLHRRPAGPAVRRPSSCRSFMRRTAGLRAAALQATEQRCELLINAPPRCELRSPL